MSRSALQSPRDVEVFDVLPVRLCIPSQSHSFAEVSFSPQTIRQHKAAFEAVVEGGARSVFVCVCACVGVCVCVHKIQ